MRVLLSTLLVFAIVGVAASFAPTQSKRATVVSLNGYVPDGMSAAQWKKHQEEEKKKVKGKNFAAVGPQSFKSRSLQSFQTDLEKGKANHLLPVMFAKDRVKKGELKAEDVPYMQRGGNWDDSDVKGAKKKQWNDIDKKQQSRTGPSSEKPATKKLFGMF